MTSERIRHAPIFSSDNELIGIIPTEHPNYRYISFLFSFVKANIISVHTDVKNICLDKEKNISKYLSAI